MFSGTASSSSDVSTYDFEENAHKWKKVFISSLEKMLETVHPTLNAREDALEYLESLVLRLLAMLCAPPAPHTVQDVEDRVLRIFPNPINRWAIGDAQQAVEKNKKKSPSLMLPTDRVHPLLKDALQSKIDMQVTVYTLAILEYVSVDILRLAGIYVKDINSDEVTQRDIRTAMCADQVLMDMLVQSKSAEPTMSNVIEEPPVKENVTLTYDQLVKDLIEHEKAYIRELNMISKVFRNQMLQIPSVRDDHRKTLDEIFSNIDEVYDFSVNLLGSLEDTIEVTKENESPAIGSCFEELAEGAEFDVYLRYCSDVVPNDRCQTAVQSLLQQPEVWAALRKTPHGEAFRDAVLYCLPRLLHLPVLHIFTDLKYIEELKVCAEACGDNGNAESLEQVQGLLCPLYSQLERIVQGPDAPLHLKRRLATDVCIRACGQLRRQSALQKLNEIQRSIEGWEGKDIAQLCNHLILEGDLKLGYPSKKQSERHVFLFDGLIILCKQKVGGYRFKEKYLMKNVDITDKEDVEDTHHAFEITCFGQQASALLLAKSAQDKHNWMAALVTISTRSTLERALDGILQDEERQHPLQLPDPAVYPFSVADSEENIIIEEREGSATPLIKGATLTKLIERLTYHMYADPKFVRTFLTTYRSFCTPMDLLELLKKRFAIPELECCSAVGDSASGVTENGNCSSGATPQEQGDDHSIMIVDSPLLHRESLKRFRKEYAQPVQFRVLNVLRHWVDYHFYDFDRDNELLDNLTQFLESVQGKSMRKWVVSITKIIQRKCNEEPREITFSQNCTPPSPKHHMRLDDKDWESILGPSRDLVKPLLMLHPIEVARQLTLLEFDLYKSVKPSELVGNAWTKKDKEQRSPNLLKMIHNTNNVIWWVIRCIIDCENFEERVAAMSRVIEIMIMFYDLNNFCGLFEITSALESASVHRLELTKAEVKRRLPPAQKTVYEEAMELGKNHHKKYLEKLRSINPPCVPFVGMYLTNIMHIEVGNPDSLGPHNLVNFSKRRKVAEITGEIQQYQNQAYCLQVDPNIRRFLENLDPFEGQSEMEINNYLYHKSTEIEPRNIKKPLVKERRWPQLSLKSPGIKPRSSRTVPNPLPAMFGSVHKDSNADGGDETPHMLTPPTPSTPCTPPANTTPTPSSSATSMFSAVSSGNTAVPSSSQALSLQSLFSGGAASSISLSSGSANQQHQAMLAGGGVGAGGTLPHGATLSSSATLSHFSSLSLAGQQGCVTASNAMPMVLSHSGTLPHSFRADRCTDQEDSVFARVEIGGPISDIGRASLSMAGDCLIPMLPLSSMAMPPPPQTPGALSVGGGIPPPLPPRSTPRRREPSLGDTSPKVQQAPDAPELPPRDVSPPPIPPRANTLPHKHHHHHHPTPASLTPSATSSLPPHSTHFPYTSSAPVLHSSTAPLHHHHHPPPPPPPHHPHHRVMAPPPPSTTIAPPLHPHLQQHSSIISSSSSHHIPSSHHHHHHHHHHPGHHSSIEQSLSLGAHLSSSSNVSSNNSINHPSHPNCSSNIINSGSTSIISNHPPHHLPSVTNCSGSSAATLAFHQQQSTLIEAALGGAGTAATVAARRRNHSIELSGLPPPPPPLSRRHTTNGPPHGIQEVELAGDSPPPPPPRLQPHTRPTSSFTHEATHHHL